MLNMAKVRRFKMKLADDLAIIEEQLREKGLTVSGLCKQAEIARSTWDRWKRGETEPNTKTWRTVQAAAFKLSTAPAPPLPQEDAA